MARTSTSKIIAALLGALALLAVAASSAAAEPFSVRTLHFDTVVGPNDDVHCDVIGDLYRPASATAAHPAPAILTTNGFGGSKNGQAPFARTMAARGYVVLSYSGLGFGGSGCQIELDDPDWDGKAGSQLISFLGGSRPAKDGTRVDYVIHDRVAHDGRHYPDDPRVGMIGGSYGGEIQFAVAGDDPRLDTIIPQITWNDLAYSLGPNNAGLGDNVTSSTPGVIKYEWSLLFFGEGALLDSVTGLQSDPGRAAGCPNFDPGVCPSLLFSALSAPTPGTVALLRHASVTSYMDRIRIPTFLSQGQADTLFTLHESVANYAALRARHVPVKLLWQQWGHSGPAAPGEIDDSHPARAYDTSAYVAWLDHYLAHRGPAPRLDFCWFRDWVRYSGNARPAYACAPRYPGARRVPLYLSGSTALTPNASSVRSGAAGLLTTALGAPTSYTETSALDQRSPLFDLPATTAAFSSAPLAGPLDVVGIPTLRVSVATPLAPSSEVAGADSELVLFVKLYDVAPNGSVTLAHRLIAPVRLADTNAPVMISLAGIVHRFAAGHRIRLVVSGGDAAYRGNLIAQPVTISTAPDTPGVLSLPVQAPAAARRALR